MYFAQYYKLCCIFVCPFAGDRYVVVDCGGGTVDLTVHQIRLPEGHLKELYKASGTKIHNMMGLMENLFCIPNFS